MITAEEYLKTQFTNKSLHDINVDMSDGELLESMIGLAKLHVEKALLSAVDSPYIEKTEDSIHVINSILNAYDLNQIK